MIDNQPPVLRRTADGDLEMNSLATVVEFFLNYDERAAAMRHPDVDAIYQWRQQDANSNGEEMSPFPRAEDRFAIGIFQALAENTDEASLKSWMSDVLTALQESKELAAQIAADYKFTPDDNRTPLEQANFLPTNNEKRMYLAARWHELLCTAELRVLGWIYQELYGKPFEP